MPKPSLEQIENAQIDWLDPEAVADLVYGKDTDGGRAAREWAVAGAVASLALEGYPRTELSKRLARQYIEGDLTFEQCMQAVTQDHEARARARND